MATLHIVNKSPFERNAFETCIGHAKSGDSILMIEDAAVGAVDGTAFSDMLKGAMADKSVFVLGGDLSARGMGEDRIIDGITVVDYAGFVDLTADNENTLSWV